MDTITGRPESERTSTVHRQLHASDSAGLGPGCQHQFVRGRRISTPATPAPASAAQQHEAARRKACRLSQCHTHTSTVNALTHTHHVSEAGAVVAVILLNAVPHAPALHRARPSARARRLQAARQSTTNSRREQEHYERQTATPGSKHDHQCRAAHPRSVEHNTTAAASERTSRGSGSSDSKQAERNGRQQSGRRRERTTDRALCGPAAAEPEMRAVLLVARALHRRLHTEEGLCARTWQQPDSSAQCRSR